MDWGAHEVIASVLGRLHRPRAAALPDLTPLETRLRALIDAKMKGKGLEPEEDAPPDRGNVVDLMAALKKSLGNKAPPAAALASKV